jgi:hypothetical protein
MTLKDSVQTARDARDAGVDALVSRLKLKRSNRELFRVLVPVLAVAGAAAIGWAIRRSMRPRIAARKMHRSIKARLANGRATPLKIARKAAAHA